MTRGLLLTLATLVVFLGSRAAATEVHCGAAYELPPDATLDDDLFAFAETVVISGTVDGDVIAAGKTVTLSETGKVLGSIMAAGESVQIMGQVGRAVRAAGETVVINGTVDGNAQVAGQNVSVSSDGSVGRDLWCAGEHVQLSGTVGGEVKAAGDQCTVEGSVAGDLSFTGNEIKIPEGGRVGGNLSYTSPNEALIANPEAVAGATNWTPAKERLKRFHFAGAATFGFIIWAVMSFVFVLFLVLLAPRQVASVAAHARRSPLACLLWGAVALIAVPVAAIVLVLPLVSIPIALFLLALYGFGVFSAIGFAAFALGRLIIRARDRVNRGPLVGALLLGHVIVAAILIAPTLAGRGWISSIIQLAATVFGLGALVVAFARGAVASRPEAAAPAGSLMPPGPAEV